MSYLRTCLVGFAIAAASCTTTSSPRPTPAPAASREPVLPASLLRCTVAGDSHNPQNAWEDWVIARDNAVRAWDRDPGDRMAAIVYAHALIELVASGDTNEACGALSTIANYTLFPCTMQSAQARGLMRCYLGRLVQSCNMSTAPEFTPNPRARVIQRAINGLRLFACPDEVPGSRP